MDWDCFKKILVFKRCDYVYLVGLVIYAFPLLSIMLGGLGYLISRNVYLIPGALLIFSLITTYTVFNTSFLMWVVIYTILSYIAGLAVKTLVSTRKRES
ncbi:DUF2651 family protein [Fictibacillus sp. 26RED30]|uniref:DUF2651 family protein n=1 Tax=Fictibacillus sp. 26RED30 TaxID=2745877 RepID=UPI00351BFE9A